MLSAPVIVSPVLATLVLSVPVTPVRCEPSPKKAEAVTDDPAAAMKPAAAGRIEVEPEAMNSEPRVLNDDFATPKPICTPPLTSSLVTGLVVPTPRLPAETNTCVPMSMPAVDPAAVMTGPDMFENDSAPVIVSPVL